MKNEKKRDTCKKNYCSKKRKNSNEANQENKKTECFYFYEADDLYYESRNEVKKQ